jgi:hypothetical protein
MIAGAMRDPETKLKMLNIAECYERLAQRAEDRLWVIKFPTTTSVGVARITSWCLLSNHKGRRDVGLTRRGEQARASVALSRQGRPEFTRYNTRMRTPP